MRRPSWSEWSRLGEKGYFLDLNLKVVQGPVEQKGILMNEDVCHMGKRNSCHVYFDAGKLPLRIINVNTGKY